MWAFTRTYYLLRAAASVCALTSFPLSAETLLPGRRLYYGHARPSLCLVPTATSSSKMPLPHHPTRSATCLTRSITHPTTTTTTIYKISKMADFDSDDLVFSDPAEPSPSRARIGEKSIQRIFQDATADRVTTKKLVKQLQYSDGGIAPGTRYLQTLWVRRFESARQAWGQDINKPYGSDDLIRFFAAIIRKPNISSASHTLGREQSR